jgi:outer membrane receptor protein involved in Fe transport
MKLHFLIIYTILLLLNTSGFSQNILIKGIINETENNQALEYVNVVLHGLPDSSIITGTLTKQSGKFELTTNKRGRFYISADYIGYKMQNFDAFAIDGSKPNIDLGSLSISPKFIGINQVDVKGERSMVSYYLDKKVISVGKNLSAQSGTAVDVLAQTSSVQTDIEGNVTLKGNSSFTVMIDGKQSPLEGSEALNQIPSAIIDRIEIITNPSVKFDPDGTGGIINIITKKGNADSRSLNVNASVGTGPNYSGDINYGYNFKKISVQTAVSYNHREFEGVHKTYRETYTKDTLFLNTDGSGNREMENFTIRANVDYKITEKNTLSFGINRNDFKMKPGEYSNNSEFSDTSVRAYSRRDFYSDTTGIDYTITDDHTKVNPVFWEFNLGDKLVFNKPDHYLEVKFNVQLLDRKSTNELYKFYSNYNWGKNSLAQPKSFADQNEDRNNLRFDANYSLPIGSISNLEAGYGYRFEKSSTGYSLYEGMQVEIDPTLQYSYNADYKNFIHYIYAVGSTKIGVYSIKLGMRLEYTDREIHVVEYDSTYPFLQLDYFPSFAISREWGADNTINLTYSKRINRPRDWNLNPFKQPTDGLNSQQGNPNLEPEYIHAIELNYQKMFGNSSAAAELFYRNTVNAISHISFIDTNNNIYVRTWDNLGAEESSGIDLSGDIKVTEWFSMNPVFSGYYFKITDGEGPDKVITDNFSYEAKLTSFVSLPSKTRLQFNANFEGPEVHVDGTEKAVWFVGMGVQQAFFDRKLSVTFKIDDIFNTRKHESTSIGENYYAESTFYRKNRQITLTVSYRLNTQKNDKRKKNVYDENGNGEEMDMGM